MSKEDCDEIKTILKKAELKPFIVSDGNDRMAVERMSEKLSFDERAQLLINFTTFPGTALYDAGDLFNANIKIDESRPLAYIEFSDGIRSRVEFIDILGSVENDAMLIGHPVILCAIQYWQQFLIWERYAITDNIYSTDEFIEKRDEKIEQKVKDARLNLEKIGKALSGSIRKISAATAFDRKLKDLRAESENTYLYAAWERLKKEYVDQTHDLSQRVVAIEEYLTQLQVDGALSYLSKYPVQSQKDRGVDPTIPIPTVINFLETDGSIFVYDENHTESLRPSWKEFRNKFVEWYFDTTNSTIKTYRKRAKEQNDSREFYEGSFLGHSSIPVNTFDVLKSTLSTPLKRFCEPIECSTDLTASHIISELISQKGTK